MKSKPFYDLQDNNYGSKTPVPTIDGLKLINHYHKIDNIFVCDGDEEFIKALSILANEDIPDNFDLMLMRVFPLDEKNPLRHVQSIKIERRGGKNNFIVIDSVGRFEEFSLFAGNTVDILKSSFPESDIYYSLDQRQVDEIGCRTYAAKDSSKMSQSENLHQELQSRVIKSGSKKGFENVRECSMPERFLVYSQSRGFIEEYGVSEDFVFEKQDGSVQSFEEKIYKERTVDEVKTPYVDTKGKVPSMIEYFANKYAKVMDDMVNSCSEKDLQEILDGQSLAQLTLESLHQIAKTQEEAKSLEKPKDHSSSDPKTKMRRASSEKISSITEEQTKGGKT